MKKPMATPMDRAVIARRIRIKDEKAKRIHERSPPTDAWALWVIYCAAAGATIYLLFFARF